MVSAYIYLLQYMFFLIFLVLAHLIFAQNYSCSPSTTAQTQGTGPSGLAPTSTWISAAIGGQAEEIAYPSQTTSFTGSQIPCSTACRDGQARSVEMQILYAPCERQIKSMRWMLEVLVSVQRRKLRAPAAPTTSTSTWRCLHGQLARLGKLARSSLARLSALGLGTYQIPEEAHSESQTSSSKADAATCQRRGQQGQRERFPRQGLCRATVNSVARTALFACIYSAFSPGDSCHDCSCLINSFDADALNATFSQTYGEQGRSGIAFVEAHVQGDQKQDQPAGGHQEGRSRDGGNGQKGGRQDPQPARFPAEHHEEEAFRNRRAMGVISPTVGRLPRQSYTDVDVACRGVRARRGTICRTSWRSSSKSADYPGCAARCTPADHGPGCFGLKRHRNSSRGFGCDHGCGRERRSWGADKLCSDQGEPQWCCSTSSQHHRGQDQEERSFQISWKGWRWICRSSRCRNHGAGRQERSGFHLAPCLRASSIEVSPGCITPGRRDTGPHPDRFRKVSFWPTIDYEGVVNLVPDNLCKFWSASDDIYSNRLQVPFPHWHSVMDEPDFRSVWAARDSALLLREALHSTAFDVRFDDIGKRWIVDTETAPIFLTEVDYPQVEETRRTDAWHEVSSLWMNDGGTHQENEPGDHPFFLHEAPETIQDLYNEFLAQGLMDGPRLSEAIHVRSWFLHHVHQRFCHTSRVLELDGHWVNWARDLAAGWTDLVRPDEALVFFICHPDPPRAVRIGQELIFDMILVQGIEFPAWAGLVTVIRADDVAARADYALAASMPRFVSGHHVAATANQIQQCHLRGCRIRQGRNILPFNYDPVHEMTNGDTFTLTPDRSQPASLGQSAAQSTGNQLDYDEETHEEGTAIEVEGDENQSDDSHSLASDATWSQAAHIYRLGHLAIFGYLDWRTYHTALRDAIQLSRIPRQSCVGFHYVQVRLPGHQAGEEAIVLQHLNDIAVGSLERLVVIDIVYHTNSLTHGLPDNPTTVREVYKVQHLLARSHLLILTHVDAYCT